MTLLTRYPINNLHKNYLNPNKLINIPKLFFGANLGALKNQINSVKAIRKVCQTMKNIAAAKMNQAMDQCIISRPFTYFYEPLWNTENKTEQTKPKKFLFVLLSSNFGMCGTHNTKVLKEINEYILQGNLSPQDYKILFLGSRAERYFQKISGDGNVHYGLITSLHENQKISFDLSCLIARKFILDSELIKYDKVVVFYNFFASRQSFVSRKIELFSEEISLRNRKHLEHYENDLFGVDDDLHLQNLYHLSVAAMVQEAISESLAVEQYARYNSMDSATSNIDEMILDLTKNYNKKRQEKITNDICEVNAGKMAVLMAEENE